VPQTEESEKAYSEAKETHQVNPEGQMMTIPRPQIVTLLLVLGALLALPAIAQAECPNEQLRRQNNSSSLPDCRAYEQVSPTEKDAGSGGVLGFNSPVQVTFRLPFQSLPDGSAITYPGEPFYQAPPKEGGLPEQYTAVRASTGGWSTVNGDTLSLQEAPVPVLPTAAQTSLAFLEAAEVLEETADGSRVFFLDDADTAPKEPDLYEYDVSGKTVTDLTPTVAGHADVQGILGVGGEGGEQGSYVYFVAGGELATGASLGADNLYLRHDGSTTFIATLLPEDEESQVQQTGIGGIVGVSQVTDWPLESSKRTAEVAPDGRYLALGSHNELTGQPAETIEIGAHVFTKAAEIFRYSVAATEAHEPGITCVSCVPVSGAVSPQTLLPSSPLSLVNGADRQRYMLNDGRLFFTTLAQLTSQDVNEQADVYEWEQGAPQLISGGTSDVSRSEFVDASTDGSDAFFVTAQALVPEDQDGITDLYDAREGGGVPPPPPPACPVEQACPGAPPAPPALAGVGASATVTGTESPPPSAAVKPPVKPKLKPKSTRCRRGFTRKHNRCVKNKKVRKTAKGRK
jgi:hypothetical protein